MATDRLVFFDLEVAGAKDNFDIVQIAAIATDSRLNVLEEFERKIQIPLRFWPPRRFIRCLCLRLIQPTVWKRASDMPEDAAKDFASFLRRHASVTLWSKSRRPYRVAQLVGHNAERFDGPLLHKWFRDVGVFLPAARAVFCTKQRAHWFFFEHQSLEPPKNFRLKTLSDYFGVSLSDAEAHDALADVRATLELYREMTRDARWEKAEPGTFQNTGRRPVFSLDRTVKSRKIQI